MTSDRHPKTAPAGDAGSYGSFRDSRRAPVHRWFDYPAGYSHRLVASKIRQYGLDGRSLIVDPFAGTGTTSVAAQAAGVNSLGLEAHPFVCWVAQTKLRAADADAGRLAADARQTLQTARRLYREEDGRPSGAGVGPDLVRRCFDEDNLRRLYALRAAIREVATTDECRDLLKLALTAVLRIVTTAGAGWPYIAPGKHAERAARYDAFAEFERRCRLMPRRHRLDPVLERAARRTPAGQRGRPASGRIRPAGRRGPDPDLAAVSQQLRLRRPHPAGNLFLGAVRLLERHHRAGAGPSAHRGDHADAERGNGGPRATAPASGGSARRCMPS